MRRQRPQGHRLQRRLRGRDHLDDSFDDNGLAAVDVSDFDKTSALVTDSFIYLAGQF